MNNCLQNCLAFVACQAKSGQQHPRTLPQSVTISRQTGCGAVEIANRLAARLQKDCPLPCGWMVFDRNLMDKVLKDHNLPHYMLNLLPEDKVSAIENLLADICDARPSMAEMIKDTTETMLGLANLGGVILIGRAANIATEKVPGALHVRLIGDLNTRVHNIEKANSLNHAEALQFVLKEDKARSNYVKTHFNAEVEKAELYDLTLNTSKLSQDAVVAIISGILAQRRN